MANDQERLEPVSILVVEADPRRQVNQPRDIPLFLSQTLNSQGGLDEDQSFHNRAFKHDCVAGI